MRDYSPICPRTSRAASFPTCIIGMNTVTKLLDQHIASHGRSSMGRFTQVPVENGSQSSTSRRYVAIAADSLAGTWILAVDHALSPVVVSILDYT